MEREAVRDLAASVLRALESLPLDAVRTLAQALTLGGGPLASLGASFSCALDDREEGQPATGWLAMLQMEVALLGLARDDDLVDRLEGAGPPWRQVRDALLAVRADRRRTPPDRATSQLALLFL